MSTKYEIVKGALATPSSVPTNEVVASSPTTFIGELYNLLFRNQKAEFTIYSSSMLIAFAYAMTKHFLLGAPQRSVLYEGSMVALFSLVVLTLGHILWAQKIAAHGELLIRITRITRHVALSATFAVMEIIAIGWLDLAIERWSRGDDKLFGQIPIDWIMDLGYLAVTGKFVWNVLKPTVDKEDKRD